MANVTVSFSGSYTIEVHCDSTTTRGSFKVQVPEAGTSPLKFSSALAVHNLSGVGDPGSCENSDLRAFKFMHDDGVVFNCTGTGDLATWYNTIPGNGEVTIDSDDVINLDHNHIRIPIVTTYPYPAAEGMVVWLEDTVGSTKRLRHAINLNSLWRCSSAVS